MSHRPTIFYILENQTLGTWWVGKMESTLDGCGMPPYRSITQDQLNDKLYEKYHNPNAYLTLIPLKRLVACYGVERWLSKLEYKINKEPEKYQELEELLKAGWDGEIETSTLSVLHVLEHNQPIDKIFKKLVSNREGLTRCLNTNKYKTYEDRKKDPDFLKAIGRKKVLRNMEKTKKLPKPETLAKYDIKDEEIKEVMGPRGIIYKITSPSGKAYVGQTIRSFEERIRNHQRKGSGCTAISRAIHKYGDEMKYEIIEDNIPHKQLDEREIYWIKELNSLAPSGYNLNTGGGQFYQITQELKDRIRDIKNAQKIDKDGYMGSVSKHSNLFRPSVMSDGKNISLSNGGFYTREEAIDVLKEYTRDPTSFTPVESVFERSKCGNIRLNGKRWRLTYKGFHIGYFDTQKEAQEALERYLKDPENFTKPKKISGSIFKSGDKSIDGVLLINTITYRLVTPHKKKLEEALSIVMIKVFFGKWFNLTDSWG
jgi:group I intron endonuclease